MRVVSDTSPVSNLAIIGRLDFLRRRYGEVRIPPAVGFFIDAEIERFILSQAGE